jgi:zinc transporter ZupT
MVRCRAWVRFSDLIFYCSILTNAIFPVEPLFAVLGALAVTAVSVILPYALAFAAAAMIYVVADDLMPESNSSGNGLYSTWGLIAGFVVMM